jgi:hypothetical protein
MTWPRLVGALGLALVLSAPAVADAPPGQYEISDQTVHDVTTGLTWQRQIASGHLRWYDAYAYCVNLSLGGTSGWRVPTVKELMTIVDERAASPAIDRNAFPDTPIDWFWSANFEAGTQIGAWAVLSDRGTNVPFGIGEYYLVRCVR